MREQMDDSIKTAMAHGNDFPLVPVSFADNAAEALGEIRAQFVVIDGRFEEFDSFQNRIHAIPREDQHDLLEANLTATTCEHSNADSSTTVGAWAAGIILGFAMGVGPSISMAFGIGAAYYSNQEEGVAGDIARAFSDVALLSHAKFIQVNEKHKVVDTLANGVVRFARDCFVFTARCRDKLFPTAAQKTKQTS